jgi:hypothetical protein
VAERRCVRLQIEENGFDSRLNLILMILIHEFSMNQREFEADQGRDGEKEEKEDAKEKTNGLCKK